MTIKRSSTLLLVFVLLLSACAAPSPKGVPKTLTVFAAASLTDAFSEIGSAFEAANPGVTVTLNFAGSQSLQTQIEQGAAADVFASASAKQMDALVAGGFVAPGSAKTFLTNQLVVIMPANNPANLTTLQDLGNPGIKIVMAAEGVPAGMYTLQALDKLSAVISPEYKIRVLTNVVSYENDVKQVVTKVQLGEADAGIVYFSDTLAAPQLQKLDIPVESNVVARYPLAVLTQAKKPELARAFTAFVLSPTGQSILQKWGFLPAD